MSPNRGDLPQFRSSAIELALKTNSSIMPKVISYDDESVEYEYVEGVTLQHYLKRTGNYNLARKVTEDCLNFLFDLSKNTFIHNRKEYILCADDIHDQNIIVSPEENFYVVDFDQFSWVHKYTYFRIIQDSCQKLTDNIRSILIDYDNQSVKKMYTDKVREINKLRKLLKQNGIDYDEHEIENMDYSIKDTGKMLVLNNFNQNRKGYDNKSN